MNDNAPVYSVNDIKRIASALIQVPHTAEIQFPGGEIPKTPTPDLLVVMLHQLRDILREKEQARLTTIEKLVWAAWGELPEDHPAPVKKVAKNLGMSNEDVSFIVYPAEEFGPWDDSQEPDLP